MVKSEIVDRLANDATVATKNAAKAVDSIFEILLQAMLDKERIELRGFGSFEVKKYKARDGRNPKTGATVLIKEKYLPAWKTGSELRRRVEDGG